MIRFGTVVDDTDPSAPVVKLDGDPATAAATPNYAAGYVPVNDDRVAVLVPPNASRLIIGVKQ